MRFGQRLIGIVGVTVAAALSAFCSLQPPEVPLLSDIELSGSGSLAPTQSTGSTQIIDIPEPTLPEAMRLPVPFVVQAPHGNWDDPYQEACEEASLLMVHSYLDGKTALTPDQADQALVDLVTYETSVDLAEDITMEELKQVTEDYYGHTASLSTDVTVDAIKAQLLAGNPVIVPAAGRRLGNPYFSGEGPWYHNLVIVGYTPTHFVTNDPGTRRGEQFQYEYDVLLDAIHDWTGKKEDIENGGKVMLIVR